MKVFITGGTGLLGRAIIPELLLHNYQIVALKRSKSNIEGISEQVEWIEGDILDPNFIEEQISNVDVVIHAAAKVNFNIKLREFIINFNINSTANVVNACLQQGRKLVHISSVAAITQDKDEVVTEENGYDLDKPNTDYALSKYLSETEVWRGIAEGLDAIIFNPAIIVGTPTNWSKSSGGFWPAIEKGLPRYPRGTAGYVDAKDIAKLCRLALESSITGERFILNAENWSYKKVTTQIAEQIGKKPPKKQLAKWEGAIFWRVNELGARLFGKSATYSKVVDFYVNSTVLYSGEKVTEAFDFQFSDIEKAIARVSKDFVNARK